MVILTQDNSRAFEEMQQSSAWLAELDASMTRAGVPIARREGSKAMILAFLLRCHAVPDALREQELRDYVREQAEAGAGTRALLDLLEGLSFFFESVLSRPDLAGSAGHPF
jgi:hypothetical protein